MTAGLRFSAARLFIGDEWEKREACLGTVVM
jgi:hypothetical protein